MPPRSAELYSLEQAWYRRELRRRPLMISTAAGTSARGPRRRAGRPHAPPAPRPRPRPQPQEEPPEPDSVSSDTSDESVRLSGSARDSRDSRSSRSSRSSGTASDSSSSSSSQYSDWEAGAALAPPARARRRPLPAKRYSPSAVTSKRPERTDGPIPTTSAASPTTPIEDSATTAALAASVELSEAYRVGEWLTAVSPRKAPYHPQMGDECLYFRLGHQRYFEAVAEKDLYKINPRDKPWERTHVNECEVVKVIGIKYVIKPPRVVCLRLACVLDAGRARTFTVRYHDMPDVIDFLVLRQQYEAATARHWGQGDRFRCMIDDSWWTGVVLERSGPGPGGGPGPGPGGGGGEGAGAFSAAAAPHFLSLKVRWDNGEVERLSPWDLEPIDMERLPSEPGGSVGVLPHELEAVLYRAEPREWPPRGDRSAACRAIAHHVSQVMSLSVAEPFVAPVDLQQYPAYARVVPYPIDLATIRARFDNLFYRRAAAAQFDVRYLATNAEQFNEPHSPIVRQARLVTDLLLHIISHWREVDVLSKYRELAAAYHSSDDEPLANTVANKSNRAARGSRASDHKSWESWCSTVLDELLRSPDAEPFKQPVSKEMAPDYSLVVPSPMDLGTVRARLAAGRYQRRAQFAHDVRKVFANSRLYNTNKRSRIYSMTVRLSALFESLWSRAPASPAPARHTRRTRHSRRQRGSRRRLREAANATEAMNGDHDPTANDPHHSDESSSSSETLAATSRRVHARARRDSRDSWDSDAPLHTHTKGKGVGKKSKSSSNSNEPVASTSGAQHVPYVVPNGVPSGSEGSALLEAASDSESEAGSECRALRAVEHELPEDERDLAYEPGDALESVRPSRVSRKRRLASESGSGSERARRWRHPHHTKRTRERFTSVSSASSNSSAYSAADARRYESDHSYRPRYSTDDDAPLHLYRQRQEGAGEEGAGAGPSSGRRHNGHARGVSLRARRSPRQYNEDSEEDSVAAISKRTQHHHQQQRRQQQQQRRRQHHAAQSIAAVDADHNYFNGHARAPDPDRDRDRLPADRTPDRAPHNGSGASAVSISSRGRVRKLTAKARGLLRE